MACSEKSSIPTSKDDSLVDLSIFERNSVFLVPSLTNFMPRFALAAPRFARSPQVGFALHEILRSGTKKTEFPPQKNKSPSFSSLLVGKGLFWNTLLRCPKSLCFRKSKQHHNNIKTKVQRQISYWWTAFIFPKCKYYIKQGNMVGRKYSLATLLERNVVISPHL